ncbi:MAG: diphosphomevalonate decarboxylase [archaeon]
MKATAIANSNLAFVKYWGKKDEKLRLPENGSISMILSGMETKTTVEFLANLKKDDITIDGKEDNGRVSLHLDRIRKVADIKTRAKVISKNNFPSSTGLSSSASGFAALTLAGTKAAGLNLSERKLSILARKGSGSACRSIPGGFVEWKSGDKDDESFSYTLFPKTYWDICDIVCICSSEKKDVSSTEGQKLVSSSPFYNSRIINIEQKLIRAREALKKRDFTMLGQLAEEEALEMHAIMMTSKPALLYLLPSTVQLMRFVMSERSNGTEIYFSLNTGQDVHILCKESDKDKLAKKLSEQDYVKKIIISKSGDGARLTEEHLQ